MAELTPHERLQPSLLDRLTDDEPGNQRESRERRVLSMERLRQSVLRDLVYLMNTGNLAQTTDLSAYPLVESSVVNFGMPDLAGQCLTQGDVWRLEQLVRQAILRFEPRLIADTVSVRVDMEPDEMSHRALTFEIEAQLWAQPLPISLFLKTEIDLETGHVSVMEAAR